MKLLLIDDSPDRTQLLVDQLRLSGSDAELRRVSTAAEVATAMRGEGFDAVVCDASLADLGVAAALEAVREGGGAAPMFVTLDAEGDDAAGQLLRALGGEWSEPEAPPETLAVMTATIEAIPAGVLVVDFTTRRAVYNARFEALWHLSAGREGAPLSDVRASLPNVVRLVVELLEIDVVSESSGTLDLDDERTIEWFSAPQLVGGRPIGRVWTFRDVSARVAAQKALEKSESKYKSLIGNIPDVLWTADARGRITFVSPNVLALDGHTPEEICNRGDVGWLDRVHPEDREGIAAAYTDLFQNELAFDVEYRIRHKNGRWIWLHDRAMSTYEIGGLRYADGVISDITARKHEQEERKRLGHERELLLDSAAEGIFGIGRDGEVMFVNRAATEILGYEASEVLGRRIHDLIHHQRPDGSPYPLEECPMQQAARMGKRRRIIDETFWRKDGVAVPVEYVVAPIIDSGRVRGAVVVFSDTTERRTLERNLEQAKRVSELGRVAATIAHEFNNVLMGIQPFAEIVKRSAGENDKLLTAARHIMQSVKRGKGVAQEILRFTRPATPQCKAVSVCAALLHLAAELRASLPQACTLEVRLPGREQEIRADWPQLEQVITNLVVNARDAMGGVGTIVLTVGDCDHGEKRVSDPGKYLRLTCTDDGPGMAAAVAARVFEPLFTTKRSGTGLGLAVAHQVVVNHGGQIYVESELGKGTSFHLLLPRADFGIPPRDGEIFAPLAR